VDRYPDESAASFSLGNRQAVVGAEEKFSKIKKIVAGKAPAGGVEAERRVDSPGGGLPMDIKGINFRVAGMMQRGGFV